jgi:hypothetical protein
VAYIIWHAVRRKEGDRALYEHVDGVLFLTQRHATVRNNNGTYPVVTIEGMGCRDDPWKGDLLDLVAKRWAARNGEEVHEVGSVEEFETIDHIPEKAPRYERWRTEYRRNPYLRHLTKVQLRDRFDEVATLNALSMLKNTPVKLTKDQSIGFIRQFGDFTQEMGDRGIPITEFQHTDEREAAACRRLSLPEPVIAWLAKLKRE